MKDKRIKVLMELRKNGRVKLTDISRKQGIPIATVFDNIYKLRQSCVKKFACLIDMQRLGFIRMLFMISARDYEEVGRWLGESRAVNNLWRVSGKHDYLAECCFSDAVNAEGFSAELEKKTGCPITECQVVEDVLREHWCKDKFSIEE